MKPFQKLFRFACLSFWAVLFTQVLPAQPITCPTMTATTASSCTYPPVQLNAASGFTTYSWSPVSGLSNPNIANPFALAYGVYTVTGTSYGPNLIINPDFSAYNTGFTSGMTYSTLYTPCDYYVSSNFFIYNDPLMVDHTPSTDNLYMTLDGCTTPTMVWQEGPFAVMPNTNYTFSFWATRSDGSQQIFENHFIGNVTGNVTLNTQNGIPYSGSWAWDQYGVPIWNSGPNTSVTLQVRNLQTNGYGDDFGLDDFNFQQICIDSATVVVTPPPPLNFGADTSICSGSVLTLNSVSANAYLWNTGDTTQSITVSSSGQYYVAATAGSCLFTDTINVHVNVLPVINLGPDTNSCGPVNLQLNAGAHQSWLWNTSDTTQTLNINLPGTYAVTVGDSGCFSSDTILISEVLPPVIRDTSICQGQALSFTAASGTSWLWNTGAQTQSIPAGSTGIYWVDATIGNCTLRDSATLTVIPLPVINLGADTTLCPNDPLVLDATGAPEDTYLWNTGATTSMLSAGTTGTYSVVVTYYGCTSSDSVHVRFAAPLELGGDASLCGKLALTLDAGNPGATYAWSNNATSQSIEVSDAGLYWVTVSDGACVRSDTIRVNDAAGEGLLFIPNTFTPNNSGLNDQFKVYGDGILSFHLRIFNRWGQLIFESNDLNAGWDGTYKGKVVQTDTYVYSIDYQSECEGGALQTKMGHVNVIR